MQMLNPNPGKRPTAEKILSVMEKEFGEIKEGITWKFEWKKLVISGFGPIPDCTERAPWREERDSIRSITIKRGVKKIGNFAFCNLIQLKTVELHSDLKRIGGGAFMNCTQMKSIAIPESVTYIGASAFENCTNLKTVHLPPNLKEIRNWTFYNCSSLQAINYESIKSIGEKAFYNTNVWKQCTKDTTEDVGLLGKIEKLCSNIDRSSELRLRRFNLLVRESEHGKIEAISKLVLCYIEGRGTKMNKELSTFYGKIVENSKKTPASWTSYVKTFHKQARKLK